MRFIKFLKTLFRSRSLDFALHSNRPPSPHEVRTLLRKGVLIHYRPGGSDVENIVKKLLKRDSEYWLPPHFEPRSILDLGANIGIASIDFALRYPQASIIAIEPVAANFQLLQKNISAFPNIRALNVAVGKHDERAALRGAGQSFRTQPVSASSKAKRREETTVRDLNALLKENEITQVDLIKIDVEGSEYRRPHVSGPQPASKSAMDRGRTAQRPGFRAARLSFSLVRDRRTENHYQGVLEVSRR